jgi:hypothetical protein
VRSGSEDSAGEGIKAVSAASRLAAPPFPQSLPPSVPCHTFLPAFLPP